MRRAFQSALCVVVLLCTFVGCKSEPPLPKLGRAPDFELTDQDGRPYGTRNLVDKIWVANFIFTSCPGFCPMLTAQMADLQKDLSELGSKVQFVSFSVDPAVDTPPVLRAYARRFHADERSWRFLTGDRDRIATLAVRGLKVPMGNRVPLKGRNGYDILHARHFVLVDRHGTIRGYYPTEDDGMARLARDVQRLADEE